MEKIMKYAPLMEKWIPEHIIGKGSFGTVYCIYDLNAYKKEKRAAKLITIWHKQDYSAYQETGAEVELPESFKKEIEKCIQEMQISDKLIKHGANVVRVYDYLIYRNGDSTDIILIMDYLTSLDTKVKEHPLEREEIIKLGIDICHTLKICEDCGVVHRDIKMENILIDENGRYLLGDFGLSREIEEAAESLRKRSGTPLYMSPESLDYFLVTDCKSDQYSLGILLYQLLNNGQIPFCDDMEDPEAVWDSIDKRRTCEELPPPANEDGILWQIIKKACAVSKADRYASAGDMEKALQAALDGVSEEEAESAADGMEEQKKLQKKSREHGAEGEALPKGPGVLMVQEDDSLVSPRLFHVFPAEKIRSVKVLDSLLNAPADATDLSESKNRSVLGWMEGNCLILAGNGGVRANADSSHLFFRCRNLTRIDFSGNFDTSDVTSMFCMFSGCSSLSALDLLDFDTSQVTDMRFMFADCTGLRSLDLSRFRTANTRKMSSMFSGCANLTDLNLSGFNLSNVLEKQYMFAGCPGETKWNREVTKQTKKKEGIFTKIFRK